MKKIFVFLVTLAVTFLFSGSTAFCQYRVVVRVVSEDMREPVEGARVKVEYTSSEYFEAELNQIYQTTDWDGMAFREFRSPGYSGYFRVTVTHPDFEVKSATAPMPSCKSTKCNVPFNISITRKAVQRKVSVYVKGENDRGIMGPIASAEVEFLSDINLVLSTQADGYCETNHSRRRGEELRVTVFKEGYKPGQGSTRVSVYGFDDHISVILERKDGNYEKQPLLITVKDQNGDPVKYADLIFFDDGVRNTDMYGNCKYMHSYSIGEAIKIDVMKKGYQSKSVTAYAGNAYAGENNFSIVLEKDADENYDFSKFSGTWQSDFGPVQLTVSKNSVSGSWKQSATQTGKITGGSVDPESKTISFNYLQPWDNKTGKVTDISFSEDPTKYSLYGWWGHDDGSNRGSWLMWRNK